MTEERELLVSQYEEKLAQSALKYSARESRVREIIVHDGSHPSWYQMKAQLVELLRQEAVLAHRRSREECSISSLRYGDR